MVSPEFQLEFEWDEGKDATNLERHGVAFSEAATVFSDPLAITFADPDHSIGEQRSLTFGYSGARRLIVVCHADRDDRVRIISAREATKRERKIYE